MENNKQNILKAFKMRKEGKSLTQIEKTTGIKRPYISFLFKNFSLDEIEQIVKNTDKIKEFEETIKTKNRRIKELKSQLENCTCWEELSFFEKFDLAIFYIFLGTIIGGILSLMTYYIKIRLFNG